MDPIPAPATTLTTTLTTTATHDDARLAALLAGRCAWCFAEAGVRWPDQLSSSVCGRHATLLLAEAARSRAQRQQASTQHS